MKNNLFKKSVVKLNLFITIPSVLIFLSIFFFTATKISHFLADKEEIAELQVSKSKIQSLEIELNEYKKEYDKVIKIRNNYRSSIKEIVELLYNKDSHLGIGSPEFHTIESSDEITLLTIRNTVASMQDDQRLLAEVKNYLSARQEFIDSFPFTWPVLTDGALDISSGFGFRDNVFGIEAIHFHQGIDIGGDEGDKIIATADGKVKFAGSGALSGNLIMISHNNGFDTRFAHLAEIKVRSGQKVERGDIIGIMGDTGLSTDIHLHYEIRHNDIPIDPLNFLTINY